MRRVSLLTCCSSLVVALGLVGGGCSLDRSTDSSGNPPQIAPASVKPAARALYKTASASVGSKSASSLGQQWERWGRATLRDGDVLFLRGECLLFGGTFDFTWFSTTACDSRFSHIAIIAHEGEQVVAYDTSMRGPRRWQFGDLMSDPAVDRVAVRRPVGEARAAIPAALRFCRETVAADVEYDVRFDPGPGQLYCSELIAAAFAAGGVELCPPVRVEDLPGIDRIHPVTLEVARRLTSLQPNSPVWSLGNESYGFWASPLLAEVLAITPADRPPTDAALQARAVIGPELGLAR